MDDFPLIRIEVLVDGPLVPRIAGLADAAGIAAHMLLTTLGGKGRQGRWRRDEVTGATAKQVFVAVTTADKARAFQSAMEPLVETHDLLVITSPAATL
jgi:hypothetical protein